MRQFDNRDWNRYPREYATQVHDLMNQYDMFISDIDIELDSQGEEYLVFCDNLHTNWKDLYNAVFKLQPDTVYEVGCGSGQHLANIQKLLPECVVAGCDINAAQPNFGMDILNISSKIYENIKILDFSWTTVPKTLGKTYDVVFSHAVLMHLSHSNAYHCLKNMLKISNKYVILLENPDDHDYSSMLDLLSATGTLETTVTYPAQYGSDLYLIEKK